MFPGFDPEAVEAHRRLERDENLSELKKFVQSLDLNQLQHTYSILNAIINGTKYSEPANWYLGLITAEAFFVRGVCAMCQPWVIHTDPMEEIEAHAKVLRHKHEQEHYQPQDEEEVGEADQPLEDEDDETYAQAVANYVSNAEQWGVVPVNSSPIEQLDLNGPVKCTGCGSDYPNLADRMLRPPGVDGCGGCQQKAMWG